MNDISETTEWGFFALVAYIPDPLRSFLTGLRQDLPGEDNPQAHITILPPRPLKLPVEMASQRVRQILRRFPSFDVELAAVRYFPGTNFLYLDVGEGNSLLHELHSTLNTGDLKHQEEFEFLPHLTLGGPVSPGDIAAIHKSAEFAWKFVPVSRRFTLDEVVFLALGGDNSQGKWHRLWSESLAAPAVKVASAAVTSRRS